MMCDGWCNIATVCCLTERKKAIDIQDIQNNTEKQECDWEGKKEKKLNKSQMVTIRDRVKRSQPGHYVVAVRVQQIFHIGQNVHI